MVQKYIYDSLGRINYEIDLAKNKKICYTYDELGRVTKRETENLNTGDVSEENYSYDDAGNITNATTDLGADDFAYDFNNRLSKNKGLSVEYDLDGNMVCDGNQYFEYDSSNRLIVTREHVYTYDVDNVRIRNCREGYGEEYDTTYVYNTNCELSQMLCKTTNGITTKYVYGLGLIGEEKCGEFKTYHFDYRGSTRFITDINGNITDTLEYDAYGKVIRRAGSSFVIFGYNGRDGSVTDANGLIYMRARYYLPELRRFVNADVIKGNICDSTSLNRYAYVNGNPVSYVDPRGLFAWPRFIDQAKDKIQEKIDNFIEDLKPKFKKFENIVLNFESENIKYSKEFNNYQHNSKNDITNSIINNQNSADVGKLKLGDYSMSNVGCGVIAVYNSKILLGEQNVSLADTIETFENEGVLTASYVSNGALGTNPYAITRAIEAEGLTYSEVGGFNEITTMPGTYVVSVWNSDEFLSGMHFVTIEVTQNGQYQVYNGNLNMNSSTEDIFVTGYKVSKK